MNLASLRDQAIVLYRQGDFAGSASACAKVIEQTPDSAVEYHLLGVIHLQQNRAEEALASFDGALQIRPDYAEALINRGNALRRLRRLPDSLASYDQALSLRPRSAIAMNNRGAVLLELGLLPEAIEACQKALAVSPGHVGALNNLGNALRRQKRFDEALAVFARALAIEPDSMETRFNRGLTFHDLGRFQEAVSDFDRVVLADSTDALGQFHRGVALYQLGQFADALASYEQALIANPGSTDALKGRGAAQLGLRRFEEALISFEIFLSLNPHDAEAHSNRGAVLLEMGRSEEGLAAFDRACTIAPDNPVLLHNRGAALHKLGRPKDSLRDYDQAARIDPANATNWNSRAGALRELGRPGDALASYDRAVTLNPDYAEAWYNRGSILREMKRFDEALRSYDMALAIEPGMIDVLSNRANLFWVTYRDHAKALRDLEKASAIDPDYPYLRGDLLHMRMYGAKWQDFDAQVAALDAGVREGRRVVSPFIYQTVSQSPQDLQICARTYGADRHPEIRFTAARLAPHDKIRIGYVSGEFRQQATSILAAGLYERHDRENFEIVAFDCGRSDTSPMRRRLENAFDRFIDISTLIDADAAARIQAEEIDILVNLNGYFGEARMGVFAHRPAPIQVNYLGFPGTLGADYMDYILADHTVISEAEQAYFSEQVAYLPNCYQVNDCARATGAAIPSRRECGLPEFGFVFCNFNQSYKLTPPVFAAWMRILNQVEGSVLWLLEGSADFSRQLRREAERLGAAGNRLVFAKLMPVEHHLARHRNADLFLDTLPCNAHTTASDALWAGLPLVTCQGTAFAGRVAASLLQAVGLPELVTQNLAEYEALAMKLAQDSVLLGSIRDRLRDNRTAAPLFDTDRYAKGIEAAYRTMWKTYQRGERPRGFTV